MTAWQPSSLLSSRRDLTQLPLSRYNLHVKHSTEQCGGRPCLRAWSHRTCETSAALLRLARSRFLVGQYQTCEAIWAFAPPLHVALLMVTLHSSSLKGRLRDTVSHHDGFWRQLNFNKPVACMQRYTAGEAQSPGGVVSLLCRQSLGGPAVGLAFALCLLGWLRFMPAAQEEPVLAATLMLVAAYGAKPSQARTLILALCIPGILHLRKVAGCLLYSPAEGSIMFGCCCLSRRHPLQIANALSITPPTMINAT